MGSGTTSAGRRLLRGHVAFGLQHSRMVVVRFVLSTVFVGVMLSSQQGFRSSLSRFHCVGLQHFGEWPVLRSLSRLRLFLFEARLSGYCVREGESRESTLRSSRLPLAHGPCRAVGFRQDECRPGGLLRGHAFGL